MKIVDYTKNDSIDKRVIIAYFDCARKGTMFTINRQLSQIVNCPLVKLQTQPSEKYKSAIAGEIEFTSDKLSTEELRIFNAWEKNAKKYLAKK
jgi:hypothetical protein